MSKTIKDLFSTKSPPSSSIQTEEQAPESFEIAEEVEEEPIECSVRDEDDDYANEVHIYNVYASKIELQAFSPKKKRKYVHNVRLSKFQPDYSQKYGKETIERSKEQGNFFCKACGTNYTLGKNGAKNIEAHIKTNKHNFPTLFSKFRFR